MNSTELANAVDRMLQGTRQHHVQLSMMADTKASMLITLSSLVITLSIPLTLRAEFRAASLVLIVCCLFTIGFATYAAMPKMPLRFTGRPDPNSNSFNLLFFGDFTRLSYDEFDQAMRENLNDGDRVYHLMLRELYTMGVFLAQKKYRYLRLANLSFLAGFFGGALLLTLKLLLETPAFLLP